MRKEGACSPERLLPGVCANVLPQVAERGEVLCASLRLAVERLARVKPLVCFESAETIERVSLNRRRLNTMTFNPAC